MNKISVVILIGLLMGVNSHFDNEITLKCHGETFNNVTLTAYYPDYTDQDHEKGYQDKHGQKLRTLQIVWHMTDSRTPPHPNKEPTADRFQDVVPHQCSPGYHGCIHAGCPSSFAGMNTAIAYRIYHDNRLEGAPEGHFGYEMDYVDNRSEFVTLAMDSMLGVPYGTKVCIPELNEHFGHRILLEVNDSSFDLKGSGYMRADICVRTEIDSYDETVNRVVTLVFVNF